MQRHFFSISKHFFNIIIIVILIQVLWNIYITTESYYEFNNNLKFSINSFIATSKRIAFVRYLVIWGSVDSASSLCGFTDPLQHCCGPAKVYGLRETLEKIFVIVISAVCPKYLILFPLVQGRIALSWHFELCVTKWLALANTLWMEVTCATSQQGPLRANRWFVLPPAELQMVDVPSTSLWLRMTWRKAPNHPGQTKMIMEL